MDPATASKLEQAEQSRINGDYDAAQPLYEEIVVAAPDCSRAWWGLAHVLMNIGEFDLAVEKFRRASEIDPANQRYILDHGMMHAMLSEFEEARVLFERVISLNPSSHQADEARKQLSYYR
jgi:Flp pilus assembly protein TadD